MPTLGTDSEAYRAYKTIRGLATYNSYKLDTELETRPKGSASSYPSTIHSAYHDAESVYWVLVDFLLCALPGEDIGEDSTHQNFSKLYLGMFANVIGEEIDDRELYISKLSEIAESFLHPGLKDMSPFLRNISSVVEPEYAWLKIKPPQDHLHEAMQRLLLEEIFRRRNDPIPLNVQRRRIPAKPTPPTVLSTGTKRKTEHQSQGRSKRVSAGA
jgi:hypothetical protein